MTKEKTNELCNLIEEFIMKYKLYGVKFEKAEHLGYCTVLLKIQVPERSEILIEGEEACGEVLAKSVKKDLLKAYSKFLGFQEENDIVTVRLQFKTYPEMFTFQKSIDEMPTNAMSIKVASEFAKNGININDLIDNGLKVDENETIIDYDNDK